LLKGRGSFGVGHLLKTSELSSNLLRFSFHCGNKSLFLVSTVFWAVNTAKNEKILFYESVKTVIVSSTRVWLYAAIFPVLKSWVARYTVL